MAAPTFQSFGNHFFVSQSEWKDNGIFTDKNHLLNLYGDNLSTYHLGVLTAWNQYSIVTTPFKDMLETKGKTLLVNGDDGTVEFSMPYKLALPTVKEDLTGDNEKPGIDGQFFEVLIGSGGDRPDFQVGEIIGYDRYDGQQVIIQHVGNRLGEGFVYTVELIAKNKKTEYFNKKFLAPGTQYFSLGNRLNELSETMKGIHNGYGLMKLKHKLGSWRGVEYTITGSAQRLKLASQGIDFERKYGADIMNPKNPKFVLAMGIPDKNGKPIPGTVTWITYAEAMLMRELYKDEEWQLAFGQAGEVTINGRKEYISEGIYHQMKAGNWLKPPRWSKGVIEDVAGKLFQNRPDIAPEDRYLVFQGGRGAVNDFRKIFAKEASDTLRAMGIVLDNSSVKVVNGDAMNLSVGALFNKVFIQGVGHVEIKYNSAFDAQGTRAEDEPLRGGYGKHSYTASIFDVTDSVETNAAKFGSNVVIPEGTKVSSNVFMIKNAEMQGVKKTTINGRTAPSMYEILRGGAAVASSRKDEFTMMLESQSSAMMVDPTRSALVEVQDRPY